MIIRDATETDLSAIVRICNSALPGAQLHLHQRLPAFMVRVGDTDAASEPESAADIFVVPC